MDESTKQYKNGIAAAVGLSAALAFLYSSVLFKLGYDWWNDENYSHGLLVPFVIALIVWREWDAFKSVAKKPAILLGVSAIASAVLLLLVGTLGAELFTSRISFVLMIAGLVLYIFGARVLNILVVPFALLLLAIPIPQIIFNRIAFPLQIWASQMAVWGMRLFEVPTLRKGNVIDILPNGSTQTVSLEVVEACSGIRSLMTLVTLGLILGYFTRRYENGGLANLAKADLLRCGLLMLLAVPIAVLTNAARVMGTGILTYHYGKQAVDGTWHDVSGWLVYVAALALLIGANLLLKKLIRGREIAETKAFGPADGAAPRMPILPVILAMLIGGIAVNWFVTRSEAEPSRRPLNELARSLGDWDQRGNEIRFDPGVESVLRTSDYTMREYMLPSGRIGNIYVGYYSSQRTGATYHSPQNCLPGAGWVMKQPQVVEIPLPDGRSFLANKYIVQNGIYNEVMIYWYQGRGRFEASEYTDKINTIWDSVTRRRTDGCIVRVMTSAGTDEVSGTAAAVDLSARLAETLPEFIPE